MSTHSTGADLDNAWISQAEAARLRQVSRQAIARLVKRGRLRTATIAGYVLVNREDVMNFTALPAGRPKKLRGEQ